MSVNIKILSSNPIIKYLPGLMFGIIISIGFEPDYWTEILFCSLFLVLAIIFLFRRNLEILSILFISFSFGIWLGCGINNLEIKTPHKIIPNFPAIFNGEIIKIINSNEKYCRFIAEGKINSKVIGEIENTRVLMTVFNSTQSGLKLNVGDIIYSRCRVHAPKRSIFQNEFSEKNYAISMDVSLLASSSGKDISIRSNSIDFNYYEAQIEEFIKERIHNLFNYNNDDIAIALLTGDKHLIPPERTTIFSYSGTAHVLAVSGLYVGIIASIVFLLLTGIKNDWVKFSLFNFFVWTYLFISGFQPSGIRAAYLAGLILLSKTLQRKVSLINTVLFGIISLIAIKPSLVFSAGFQMSVSAIIGIYIFYNPINAKLQKFNKTKSDSIKYIFNSMSLTISASTTISFLVAYYFGIYSVYSILANLFVVPLMSLSLIYTLLSLILSFISFGLGEIFAYSSRFLIDLSISINQFIVSLPFSYIKNENIVLISLFISVFILYIILSKSFKLMLFRLLVAIFICLSGYELFFVNSNNSIRYYPDSEFTACFVPLNQNSEFVYISDRKPHEYPIGNLAIEKYLIENPNNLYIAIDGLAGIAILDNIKKKRKFHSFEFFHEDRKKFEKIVNLKEPLCRVIDY